MGGGGPKLVSISLFLLPRTLINVSILGGGANDISVFCIRLGRQYSNFIKPFVGIWYFGHVTESKIRNLMNFVAGIM